MLFVPRYGIGGLASSQASTTNEGITVTASGSIHTKGSWGGTPLWTSTPNDSYGIWILITGLGTASTNSRALVDIGVGAGGSEVVLIPNLMCGNQGTMAAAMNSGAFYFFPLFIPAATRINARIQGLIASDTATVRAWLNQEPSGPDAWYGRRVTDYGTSTATSSGVSHTPGTTSAYATATQIIASTTNPIKALQIGIDLATGTSGQSTRNQVRIGLGATPNYFVSDLPCASSTTVESEQFMTANAILSHMRFNIPSASDLRISAMCSGTGAARGWALYGVD